MDRKDVAIIAKAYLAKPENGVGGNLHIVIEDGNLENHHINFCIKQAQEKQDPYGVVLGNAILQLTMTQRKKMYRNHWSA